MFLILYAKIRLGLQTRQDKLVTDTSAASEFLVLAIEWFWFMKPINLPRLVGGSAVDKTGLEGDSTCGLSRCASAMRPFFSASASLWSVHHANLKRGSRIAALRNEGCASYTLCSFQ